MALDPNRWTQKTTEAFNAAVELARTNNNPEVTPDHLLLAMLGQEGTVVFPVLQKVGVAPAQLRSRVVEAVSKLPKAYGGAEPSLGRAAREALEQADRERVEFGDEYVSIEHVLLALTDKIGVARDDVLAALKEVRGSHRVTSQNPEDQFQALEKYGRDLTADARKGKLDPVIGRDEEIRRTIQVLSRRTKNNPVLIGEPGVGDLLEHGLETVLELAAVLGARDEGAEVEREDALLLERLGDVAGGDAQRDALGDGRLSDSGVADEHGVVLRAPREHLHGAADLLVAADDGVELALPRLLGQVPAVLLQGPVLLLRVLGSHPMAPPDVLQRFKQVFLADPKLVGHGQKQVLEVRIERDVFASKDQEMLQDLIRAAVNEASRRVDDELADQLKSLGGVIPGIPGLKIPGLF